ncbi:MAG: family 43 glycosylhydrolase, partial [Sphaerochaetaceae bacterium]
MTEVQNPVLRGFNPDPSMLRVGDDYYLATSTFEWFPAVQIYHSRDLVNWRLIIRPLDQIDLRGCGPSCGVWAPDLSFDGKRYYLAYTIVHTKVGFKDTHNYIVSAPSIMGPWSAPSYLGSFGFDPSLFHDKDGRKWTVTMTTDNRKGKSPFAGIILQEWDARKQKNIGEKELIWNGTRIGRTEAPHIYHLGRYYYLFCAEGGTYYPHAESVARALSIHGPYEAMPGNPLLTSNVDACGGYDYENEIPKNPRGLPLEKSGHAALVELPE